MGRKVILSASLCAGIFALLAALWVVLRGESLLKGRITAFLSDAVPAYSFQIGTTHLHILENRIVCDSIAVKSLDSTMGCRIAAVSLSGVNWWNILLGETQEPEMIGGAVLEAEGIACEVPEAQYRIRCGRLRIAVAESVLAVEDLSMLPMMGDEQFFRARSSRRTRFDLQVRRCDVTGAGIVDAWDHRGFHARRVRLEDVTLDVLVNKDKPSPPDSSRPPMPSDLLLSVREPLRCDTVVVTRGALKYGERFVPGAKPGLITIDSTEVRVEGITNHPGADAAIHVYAQGTFMRAGTLVMRLVLPIPSPALSCSFSGSLSSMDLRALNGFLEVAERSRITAGTLRSAAFDVNVVSGHARGAVRAIYRDLTFAVLDKQTGRAGGVPERLASFVANHFKVRTSNLPDKKGVVKAGKVKFVSRDSDPFFRILWFAVRSGVLDITGL